MGEHEVFSLDHLRGKVADGFVLSSELGTTFLGGGVDAKHAGLLLVGVSEAPEETVSLAVVLLVREHVATVSPPGGLWHFVVE